MKTIMLSLVLITASFSQFDRSTTVTTLKQESAATMDCDQYAGQIYVTMRALGSGKFRASEVARTAYETCEDFNDTFNDTP